MSNQEIARTDSPAPPRNAESNPFAKRAATHANVGAVSIEGDRAIAEVQAAYVMAKQFPRDEFAAYEKIMVACSRIGLAEVAQYSFKRSEGTVTGPSIRLAEELARCWGNIQYGMKELSRRPGSSEILAFAIDLETGTRSEQVFTVNHVRDSRSGKKDLTDERDIYEIGANMGARRLRERILAVIPPDFQAAAIAKCNETLKSGGGVPLVDRIRGMVSKFAELGVTVEMLEKRLGKAVGEMLPGDVAEYIVVYKSIRDGDAKAGEFFGGQQAAQEGDANPAAGRLASVAARGRQAAAQAEPDPVNEAPPIDDSDVEI